MPQAQSVSTPAPIDWAAVRERFPAAATCHFLNTASRGLLPDEALAAGKRYYEAMHADASVSLGSPWSAELEAARARVAGFIGAGGDQLAFVPNASTGLNLLADMLGGHAPEGACVVAHRDEFPSVTLPWLQRGYTVRFLDPDEQGAIGLEAVDAALAGAGPGPRFVAVSAVQYASGFVADLAGLRELCSARGAMLVCDATQAVGVIPVDVRRFRPDGLVFSGYKWACAGYGVAGLYVDARHLEERPLPAAGWRSAEDPYRLRNDRAARARCASALELGNPIMPGPLVLDASLGVIAGIGIEAVAARSLELGARLRRGLADAGVALRSPPGPAGSAGITMFAHPDPDRVERELRARRVHVSVRSGLVRVSPHLYSAEADVDTLLEVVEGLA